MELATYIQQVMLLHSKNKISEEDLEGVTETLVAQTIIPWVERPRRDGASIRGYFVSQMAQLQCRLHEPEKRWDEMLSVLCEKAGISLPALPSKLPPKSGDSYLEVRVGDVENQATLIPPLGPPPEFSEPSDTIPPDDDDDGGMPREITRISKVPDEPE